MKFQCSNCSRSKSFNICEHVIAVAHLNAILTNFVENYNSKVSARSVASIINVDKPREAGKKKTKKTQKRRGPPNAKTEEVTILVNPGFIGETCEENRIPINDDVIQPKHPDPLPNAYVLTLLRYCHKNVSSCYGCSSLFRSQGYPDAPHDFVVVSKTHRSYIDPATHKRMRSDQMSRVYYHFNTACISKHNAMFTPQLLTVPQDLRPFLQEQHISVLQALSIPF